MISDCRSGWFGRIVGGLSSLGLLPLAACGLRAQSPEFAPVTVIPRPFPAIKSPPAVSAQQAGEWLGDDELVLGVEVAGAARAYPINMLVGPQREIINDQLGGSAIAATW